MQKRQSSGQHELCTLLSARPLVIIIIIIVVIIVVVINMKCRQQRSGVSVPVERP